jgi:hypothetical protein
MILVGRKSILEEIKEEVKNFNTVSDCPLDYVILMKDEWEQFVKEMNMPYFGKTQFLHGDILLVKEGYYPNKRGHKYE